MRTKIVPIIIGALGTIKKGFDQNLQLLAGNLLAIELLKITLMSHCTQHLYSAGINCFNVLLRPGFTRRPPPNN